MMRVENRNGYLNSLLAGRETDAGSGWLRALRMRAVERANELSVPTMRDEEWRFTDLSPLYKIPFQPASGTGNLDRSQLDAFALPEAPTRLVFVDDPGCAEGSVLRMTYPTGEWSAEPVEPKACSCGDVRCQGRLVITLHESHAGPNWMLTFRG